MRREAKAATVQCRVVSSYGSGWSPAVHIISGLMPEERYSRKAASKVDPLSPGRRGARPQGAARMR
jgi:hypothetical protein